MKYGLRYAEEFKESLRDRETSLPFDANRKYEVFRQIHDEMASVVDILWNSSKTYTSLLMLDSNLKVVENKDLNLQCNTNKQIFDIAIDIPNIPSDHPSDANQGGSMIVIQRVPSQEKNAVAFLVQATLRYLQGNIENANWQGGGGGMITGNIFYWVEGRPIILGGENYYLGVAYIGYPRNVAISKLWPFYIGLLVIMAGFYFALSHGFEKYFASKKALELTRHNLTKEIALRISESLDVLSNYSNNLRKEVSEDKNNAILNSMISKTDEVDEIVREVLNSVGGEKAK